MKPNRETLSKPLLGEEPANRSNGVSVKCLVCKESSRAVGKPYRTGDCGKKGRVK